MIAVERPLGCERADVQLIEHQVLPAHPGPIAIGPREPFREHDGRGAVDALGLPQRTGIGAFGTIVEAEGIAQAVGHAHLGVLVVSAVFRVHRHLSPRVVVHQDEAHALGLRRPDPPIDRTVRRPDRPASPRPTAQLRLIHGHCAPPGSLKFPTIPPEGIRPDDPTRPDTLATGDRDSPVESGPSSRLESLWSILPACKFCARSVSGKRPQCALRDPGLRWATPSA